MSAERLPAPAEVLREEVRHAYGRIAERPEEKHPFPVGRALALGVGYPQTLLDRLPREAVEAFAGVLDIGVSAEMAPGDVVLDLGCGAGMDSFVASERVGPEGSVTGVDFSDAMIARAERAKATGRFDNLRFVEASGEALPVESGSIDVAIVNGIFNLNPRRAELFRELARVLAPGGKAFIGELVLAGPLLDEERSRSSWFA